MAFNQSQDTISTLKLIIFLVVIEFLFYSASTVVTLAQGDTANYDLFGNTQLSIDDFSYHAGGWYVIDQNGLLVPYYTEGYYTDNTGHIVNVDEGDISGLKKAIDDWNNQNPLNAFSFLTILVSIVTFSFIPAPLNVVPLMVTAIIGFVVVYLAYSEVKGWFSAIIP
jgi:hypothetical protein